MDSSTQTLRQNEPDLIGGASSSNVIIESLQRQLNQRDLELKQALKDKERVDELFVKESMALKNDIRALQLVFFF